MNTRPNVGAAATVFLSVLLLILVIIALCFRGCEHAPAIGSTFLSSHGSSDNPARPPVTTWLGEFFGRGKDRDNLPTGTPVGAEGRSDLDASNPKAHANSTCGPNSRHERNGNAGHGTHAETAGEPAAFTGGLPNEADQAVKPTDPGRSCAEFAREPVNANLRRNA